MKFVETPLAGAYIVEIEPRGDERGFFARTYCAKEFAEHGLSTQIAQANMAVSATAGTLRGMHFQMAPNAEIKLIRCTRGSLFDVIVDLRPGSATYRQWFGIELAAGGHQMVYVPEQFAHGYLTLEDSTEITYQVSEFYAPGAEQGIAWDDPAVEIEWPLQPKVISDKDQAWPALT